MSRYFRFGLRTILIVTTIAAVLFAFLGRDIVRARREKPIIDRILNAKGSIRFEGDLGPARYNYTSLFEQTPFLQRQFGRHFGVYVEEVSLDSPWGNPTDKTIQGLSQFERLRTVSLRGRGVTDKSVDELLRVQKLDSLDLFSTSISLAGLKRLTACSNLEGLTLADDYIATSNFEKPSDFGNAHLELLPEFPALRRLGIYGRSITDDGLAHVGKCTNLTGLVIDRVGITDDAFEHLTNLQQLQSLEVYGFAQTDKSMQAIGKLRRLKVLRLDSKLITDEGLAHLKGLTELEELHLELCTPFGGVPSKLNGSGLAALISLQKLRTITISSPALNDEGLAAIASLPALTELQIDQINLDWQTLRHFEQANNLRRLSSGDLNTLKQDAAKQLKAKLPNCIIDWSELDSATGASSEGSL